MFIGKFVDERTDALAVDGYEAIYDAVLALANDADGFGLFDAITPEDVQKCTWIAAICEVLDDVPRRRVKHIFEQKNISFDYSEFFDDKCH